MPNIVVQAISLKHMPSQNCKLAQVYFEFHLASDILPHSKTTLLPETTSGPQGHGRKTIDLGLSNEMNQVSHSAPCFPI